jgi:antitoxin component YwqK of YwqJK toxin-antitoxin module
VVEKFFLIKFNSRFGFFLQIRKKMKKLGYLILLLLTTLTYSQTPISIGKKDKIIYLDSTWSETTQDNYTYYRLVKDYFRDKDLYKINDFYKSGVLQREGTSITQDGELMEGEFIFYYENGNKKALTNYIKSRPNGKYYEWYDNGNKKLEGEYIKNEKSFVTELKIVQFWNSKHIQTVIDGNGNYEDVDENFFESGKIKDGFRDGFWKGYDKKGGITFIENYTNRKLISGVSTDLNKVEHNYTEIKKLPEPQKGIQHLGGYFARNFIVPDIKGLNGKIYVKFAIEKDGSVIDVKVLKDIGHGTGLSIMKIASRYNSWIPGEKRGIKERSTYILPISIKSAN